MKKKHDDSALLFEQTQNTYDLLSSVISNNDCTGLAPTGLKDNDQTEGYKELYYMNPPKTFDLSDAEVKRTKK